MATTPVLSIRTSTTLGLPLSALLGSRFGYHSICTLEKIRAKLEMPTEPQWSKAISNSSVCTWFFVLATIDAILGVAVVLLGLNLVLNSKINTVNAIMLTLGAAGAFANSWFLFLICNRTLNVEGFYGYDPKIDKGWRSKEYEHGRISLYK